MKNPYGSNEGVGIPLETIDDDFILIVAIFMFLINPYYNAKDAFQKGEYLFLLTSIIALIIAWAVLGGIIYLLYYLWTGSRSCLDNQEKYIVQRDLFDFFTPEYTVYFETAPVGNYESAEFPPAVRVDTPVEGIRELFFPNFRFVAPEFPATYLTKNFVPLEFTRLVSFRSIVFPSYSVSQNGNEIAQILYPMFEEEADFWSLTGLEKRYVIRYNGEVYVTSEELGQIFEGTLVKTLNFYNFNTGDEDAPIAEIKVRANALNRTGLYTVCINTEMDPILKELLFATVLAYDQHVIEKEKRKNN